MKKKICFVTAMVMMAALCSNISFNANAVDTTDAKGHVWSEWIVDIQPTCTQMGHAYRICTAEPNFTHQEEQMLLMIDHDYMVTDTPPTCQSPGVLAYMCSMCGDTYAEEYGQRLEHYFEEAVTKEPSCDEIGVRTFTCVLCNTSYTEEIEALGHDYKEEVKEASCEKAGEKVYTCSRCDDTYKEAISPMHHEYTEKDIKPTCEKAGEKIYTCNLCGKTYSETYGEKLKHEYVLESETSEELKYVCINCGDTYTRKVPQQEQLLNPTNETLIGVNGLVFLLFGFLLWPDIAVLLWFRKRKKAMLKKDEIIRKGLFK